MAVTVLRISDERVISVVRGREAVKAAAAARKEEIESQCKTKLKAETAAFERLLAESMTQETPEKARRRLRFLFDSRQEFCMRRTQISELPPESTITKSFLKATERKSRFLQVVKNEHISDSSVSFTVNLIEEKRSDPATVLTSENLDILAWSDDPNERAIAARSVFVRMETLERLLEDQDPEVRFTAALQKEMLIEKQWLMRGI